MRTTGLIGAGARVAFVVAAGFGLRAAWIDLIRWPRVGSYWSLLVMLCAVGAVYQLLLLGWLAARRRLPDTRWPARLVALVLGLVGGAQLLRATDARALEQVRARHAPLFARLAGAARPCDVFAAYRGERGARQFDTPRALHAGGGRYVLVLDAGSIDIDGSTLYVDSTEPGVHLFHNDDTARRQALEARLQTLQPCTGGAP